MTAAKDSSSNENVAAGNDAVLAGTRRSDNPRKPTSLKPTVDPAAFPRYLNSNMPEILLSSDDIHPEENEAGGGLHKSSGCKPVAETEQLWNIPERYLPVHHWWKSIWIAPHIPREGDGHFRGGHSGGLVLVI